MAIPILSEIERFIVEHGSSVVLKEHLALLQNKLVLLKDEISKLEKENSDLKTEVSKLTKKLSAQSVAQEFTEERGALFKRKPSGGYHSAVYCPRCFQSAAPFPPGAEFSCNCGWFSSFTESELQHVIASIAP
jgi:hypothetical protein